MTDYILADTGKQRLTEWMGEKWVSWKPSDCSTMHDAEWYCRECRDKRKIPNRTFTTPQDVFDLKDRLVEKGLWGDFYKFADKKSPFYRTEDIVYWLFRTVDEAGKPHFARLCCEFLEEGK